MRVMQNILFTAECEHDWTYSSNLAHYGDDSIGQTRARALAFAFPHHPHPFYSPDVNGQRQDVWHDGQS